MLKHWQKHWQMRSKRKIEYTTLAAKERGRHTTETAEAELDAESDGSALAEADWAEADADPDRATAEAEDPALGSVGVLGMVGSLGFWATLINPNCGERFLIKRLRLSWSRRWGWAKS
jgi:hypothetical protein